MDPEPPAAVSVALYCVPTVPLGNEVVVMVSPLPAEAMVIFKFFVTLSVPLVALTVKSAVPLMIGAPEMVPLLDKFSP